MKILKTYQEIYRGAVLEELLEMKFRQFVYLDAISRMDNPTYGDLARKFKVTKPAVTAAVNKLINLGYLKRVQSSEDRRVYHLLMCDKGRRMLEIDDNTATLIVKHMKNCLTRGEVEQFIAIAEKIIPLLKGNN